MKGKRDEEETLGSCQLSQADWIRQYMRRLEEVLIKECLNHFYKSRAKKRKRHYFDFSLFFFFRKKWNLQTMRR